MVKKLAIPTNLEAITLDWLNEALRSTGAIKHATIQSFQMEDMGESAGFFGQLAKLKLNYLSSPEMAPASLIVKLPPPDTGPHSGGTYEREVRFYQGLARRAHLPAPQCYYADFDPETGRAILLLEDLSHLKQIGRATGCTFAEAEMVIQHLGQFHAHWWNSPELPAIELFDSF
jgi:hypothetical protein